MIFLALTAAGLALVLFGFVMGVLYERTFPTPMDEPPRRRSSSLRLVSVPFDQDAPRAPFSVEARENTR